jgi:succinylglutamate desuccinylase
LTFIDNIFQNTFRPNTKRKSKEIQMTFPNGVEYLKGKSDGPTVGIMGICHGNEAVGLKALQYLKNHFQAHQLEKGELFLIQGNPKAYQQQQLCIDYNLNRLFLAEEYIPAQVSRNSYEYRRAAVLKPILKDLDFFLDLHATNKKSPPFSSVSPNVSTSPAIELASLLPVEFYSYGWAGKLHGSARDWVFKSGGISVTIECGHTDYPEGEEIAIEASKRFLQYLGLYHFGCELVKIRRHLIVSHLEIVQNQQTFRYLKNYQNFQPLQAGEIIAQDASKIYQAQHENQVIVFPTSEEHIRTGAIKEAYLLGEFHD